MTIMCVFLALWRCSSPWGMTYVSFIMMLVAGCTRRHSRTTRSYHFVGRFSNYANVPLEGHATGLWHSTHAQRKLLVLGVASPRGEAVHDVGSWPASGRRGVFPHLSWLIKGKNESDSADSFEGICILFLVMCESRPRKAMCDSKPVGF